MFELSNLSSNSLVAICCLVFGAVFICLLAYRSKDKNHIAARILLSNLALLALTGLWFTPSFQKEQPRPKSILLSNSYNTESKDSLINKYPNVLVKTVTKQQTALNIPSKTDTLFLLGNGFSDKTLKDLPSNTLIDLLNPSPIGLENIKLASTLVMGESIEVIGKVDNRSQEAQQLYLSFFDKTVDSINIAADSIQWFSFSKTANKSALWEGQIWLENDTLKNSFGVEVLPNNDLAILVLEAAPSFELKELKKWLTKDGQTLVSRTTVSKGKNQFAFFNTTASEFDDINMALLDQFNWLIITAEALKGLSITEKTTLEKALRNGKNILVLMKEKRIDLDFNPIKNFDLLPLNTNDVKISLENYTISLKKNEAYLDKKNSQKTLITDNYKRSLVAYKQYDLGKIGVSTLSTTYPLLLKGAEEEYQILWETIARPFTKTYKSSDQIVLADYPIVLPKEKTSILFRSNEQLPSLNIYQKDSLLGSLYLQQQRPLSNYWEGDWWFDKKGWYKITNENGSVAKNLYVASADSWKSIRMAEQLERNRRFIQNQLTENIKRSPYFVVEKMSLWWFYGLFLLSLTGLWILERIK